MSDLRSLVRRARTTSGKPLSTALLKTILKGDTHLWNKWDVAEVSTLGIVVDGVDRERIKMAVREWPGMFDLKTAGVVADSCRKARWNDDEIFKKIIETLRVKPSLQFKSDLRSVTEIAAAVTKLSFIGVNSNLSNTAIERIASIILSTPITYTRDVETYLRMLISMKPLNHPLYKKILHKVHQDFLVISTPRTAQTKFDPEKITRVLGGFVLLGVRDPMVYDNIGHWYITLHDKKELALEGGEAARVLTAFAKVKMSNPGMKVLRKLMTQYWKPPRKLDKLTVSTVSTVLSTASILRVKYVSCKDFYNVSAKHLMETCNLTPLQLTEVMYSLTRAGANSPKLVDLLTTRIAKWDDDAIREMKLKHVGMVLSSWVAVGDKKQPDIGERWKIILRIYGVRGRDAGVTAPLGVIEGIAEKVVRSLKCVGEVWEVVDVLWGFKKLSSDITALPWCRPLVRFVTTSVPYPQTRETLLKIVAALGPTTPPHLLEPTIPTLTPSDYPTLIPAFASSHRHLDDLSRHVVSIPWSPSDLHAHGPSILAAFAATRYLPACHMELTEKIYIPLNRSVSEWGAFLGEER
eukprot:TRINITY_DN3645_c2_g1_i1.p1 TRINITY_DN3645_c2_g1~~TRINITY_DN3645_c2_g1_i1.p1  ORF type:complete len:602 (+),score=37.19 TRINITY_DN3645_c2_g1_i1:74-1807(+)